MVLLMRKPVGSFLGNIWGKRMDEEVGGGSGWGPWKWRVDRECVLI